MARTEELNRYYKHVGKRPDLFKKQGALELVLDEEEIAEFEADCPLGEPVRVP